MLMDITITLQVLTILLYWLALQVAVKSLMVDHRKGRVAIKLFTHPKRTLLWCNCGSLSIGLSLRVPGCDECPAFV